ncbi:MAG TPA: serine hydrolase domain-containing protein [Patescibacteria group bacterium]|nr:serine hydrolase domain-containing protein [Patescibacteria group bacterium]
MKKLICIILIIIMILMAVPLTAIGQEEGSISQYLDKTLSEMVNQKQVKGAIVSVVSNDINELCKGYGFTDEEKGIAAHKDNTAFRIGSISKTFVTVAALQLAQDGKLNMKAPVSIYLERDFPKLKYDVTMNDLLTYTAGFEDMFSGIAVFDVNKADPLSLSVRKYLPAQVFAPGEVVSYSNYSIALAAYVVQRISGVNFYEYAEENIFKPLGMEKTSFKLDYRDVVVSKAYGTNGKEKPEPFMNLYPEGSVVSTAADMSKYMLWLMDDSNRILNTEVKQQIFDQHFAMSNEFGGMGYTWNRLERNGALYYTKKGETPNFFSRIAIYPEQKTGVFVSVNTYVDEEKLNVIMDETTTLLLGSKRQQDVYTGAQTADISGYYIRTRSNFENQENVVNFLTPQKAVHITGSINKGFSIEGKKLLPIGENYYSSPIGNFKYIKRDGGIYLANNSPDSYVRIPWYESNGIQLFIFAMFAVLGMMMAVVGIIRLFRKKARSKYNFLESLSILHFVLFIGMVILMVIGISNLDMLKMAGIVSMCGILIVATSLCSVLYTVYVYTRKTFNAHNILLTAWSISNILFCLWMLQVNIL